MTTLSTESTPLAKPSKGVRVIAHIARILLGALFTFAGLNIFFKWVMPPADHQPEFPRALMQTGYMMQMIGATQLFVGVLFLINRYVAFAVVVFTPLMVNIVALHFFKDRDGLPMALIVMCLWAMLVWAYRSAYVPLFVAQKTPG